MHELRPIVADALGDLGFDDPDAVFGVQTVLDVCRWMA